MTHLNSSPRRRRTLWAWAALGVFLALGGLFSPREVRAQGTEYQIGVSDVLDVTVWQRKDLGGSFTVDAEGNVTMPLIGAVRAVGSSPARLSEELTRRFSFLDRDVSQVTVAIAQYNSRRVFVMGEVQRPGAYSFPKMPGLWEVIREAGGPTAEASLGRVRVIPPEGQGSPVVIDLDNVISTGDFSTLPELKPGTTILIPRTETVGTQGDVIYVYGSVTNPGTFAIGAARTVLQAVIAAGGPRADADVGAVRVVRPGPVRARVIQVDLEDYTHEGVLFSNVRLLPGDTVTVPKNQKSVAWRIAREAVDAVSGFLASILFFGNIGNEDNGTTIVVDGESGETIPAP